MSYYVRHGNVIQVTNENSVDIQDRLPVGNYAVGFDQMKGDFFLTEVDSFTAPSKVYGDTMKNVSRILSTFDNRPSATGVLLSGEKGSGKTLLSKMLSVTGAESGIPTIVINQPWCGDEFNQFIQRIDQPTIIIFDEFEKVYNKENQTKILTLMDGVFPSKKLFVLTVNDPWAIDSHMRNRPGRLFYMIEYKGLEQNFIEEYCADVLTNKEHTKKIVNISTLFDNFNFDMLKALIEEVNRYNEDPFESLKMLNIKSVTHEQPFWNIDLVVDGTQIDKDTINDNCIRIHPLDITKERVDYEVEVNGEHNWKFETFTLKDLIQHDSVKGEYVFKNSSGAVMTMTRRGFRQEGMSKYERYMV